MSFGSDYKLNFFIDIIDLKLIDITNLFIQKIKIYFSFYFRILIYFVLLSEKHS